MVALLYLALIAFAYLVVMGGLWSGQPKAYWQVIFTSVLVLLADDLTLFQPSP
ncbi:hypothetical protein [Micromonospora sp. NPDC048947]|uniref:hypothetical protein n=1 Tax=Micromonospora sp. NPDC048947 TaxID=3154826 RepID=UPI0033C76FE9